MAKPTPCNTPYLVIASEAYWEQLGSNLQVRPYKGEITMRYPWISPRQSDRISASP
ncbi:hypothetical protein COMA2_170093 [Candidatus Nitrospira nitrificans]|uniref:Uncharacterized protein n=1 Tax=Candidatus Nitrospira nitrificans TaxID=1742973 RepID=A0A0S4LF98_9BACT|nr:hypothetical protein COMA2_170093 [Candidatus Nitrospira nitrificans]